MRLKLFIFTSFVFCISILFFSSCTKTNTETIVHNDTTTIITHDTVVLVAPTNPIVGLWIGSQVAGDGSSIYPLYYSFDIKSDSILLVQGQGGDGNTFYSNGVWSLSGTAFTATITISNFSQTGVKQNITAVYDKIEGKLKNGTIQTIGYPYSSTFTLDRVN
jgi:hypothetical protein